MNKNISIEPNEYYKIYNDCISDFSDHAKNMISSDMIKYMYEHSKGEKKYIKGMTNRILAYLYLNYNKKTLSLDELITVLKPFLDEENL